MSNKKLITINEMRAGQSGMIVQLIGGRLLSARLESLGIRPGTRITKISSMLFKGPVTVRFNGTQAALGFGMATKVMVEPDTKTSS
jgi:ferrous iron transport protein A